MSPTAKGDAVTDDLFDEFSEETQLGQDLADAVIEHGFHSEEAQDLLRRLNDLHKAGTLEAAGDQEARLTARQHKSKENQDKFIAECVAIEAEAAQEAGMVGYMARVLVQATMPHSKPQGNEYARTNGRLHVSIMAPGDVGLPYGSYPRLLLTWLTTEAVRTQSSTLHLGESLSEFMRQLGLIPTGGRWGTMPRLRDQANRLFKSFVTAYEDGSEESGRDRGSNIQVAHKWDVWWHPTKTRGMAEQGNLFTSWVKLTDDFYNEVIDRPVPVDLRAIRALKKSPLALDLYAWTTYRVSYLNRRTEIPWQALQMQFGSNYGDTPQGQRNFKRHLFEALRKVQTVYPDLRASEGDRGLVLLPSPSHILPKR